MIFFIIFDIVCVIVALSFIVRGYFAGFIISISSFLSLFISFISAITFWSYLSTLIAKLGIQKFSSVISFILIFVVVYILISTVTRVIQNFIHMSGVGAFIDGVLGGIFGLLKALLVILLLSVLVYSQPVFNVKPYQNKSYAYSLSYKIIEKYKETFFNKINNFMEDGTILNQGKKDV